MYLMEIETTHFSFAAVGVSREEAFVNLERGLRRHSLDYGLSVSLEWAEGYDLIIRKLEPGCYRDGDPIATDARPFRDTSNLREEREIHFPLPVDPKKKRRK